MENANQEPKEEVETQPEVGTLTPEQKMIRLFNEMVDKRIQDFFEDSHSVNEVIQSIVEDMVNEEIKSQLEETMTEVDVERMIEDALGQCSVSFDY